MATKPYEPLVTLDELAGHCGGSIEHARAAARNFKHDVVRDWADRECVTASAAADMRVRYREEVEENRAQNARYNAYLAERKRAAEEKVAASIREAHEKAAKLKAAGREEAARQKELEALERASRAEAEAGSPVGWTAFFGGKR